MDTLNKHYKFLHVFYHGGAGYIKTFVEMINDADNGFRREEHLFVTPHLDTYEAIKSFPNVVLHKLAYKNVSPPKRKLAKVLNDYGDNCDWIFMHCSCRQMEILKIKKRFLHKIIWRTWGHEQYTRCKPDSFIGIVKWLLYPAILKRIKLYKAIGAANIVDKISLTEKYGQLDNIVYLPYARPTLETKTVSSLKIQAIANIVVGHSADPVDRHIEIMEMLEKWKAQNIKIYLPIAYGDKKYAEKLIDYLTPIWGKKIEFITEMMDYNSYKSFFSNMDVIILPAKHSYALGNIGLAVFYEKKVCLDNNGIIRRAFDHDKVPYITLDDMTKMDFEEFRRPLQYPDNLDTTLSLYGYKRSVEQWYKIFDWLKAEK